MNWLGSKCMLDTIPSSFLSGWNLNGLFQCKSENVTIWLMKQTTGFGFLSKCRVGIESNPTFWKARGNVSHPATEPAALGCCVFCTLLPSGATASQRRREGQPAARQGAALLSFPKPAGQKTHLKLWFLSWSYFFAKPEGSSILPIMVWKTTVFKSTEQGIRSSQIRKPQRPTRSFIAAIL